MKTLEVIFFNENMCLVMLNHGATEKHVWIQE